MGRRRVVESGRTLAGALHGFGKEPAANVAVLVDENAHLRAYRISGAPNYLTFDREYPDPATGGTRIITFRYVRTDLTCQSGHRVYVISEVTGHDSPIEIPGLDEVLPKVTHRGPRRRERNLSD